MQPPAANAIRTKHSRYELLERVGSGHLAEVFKARATGVAGFAKIVAIKRLLPEAARDPGCVALFNDEARVAAALSHANIAQVFECGSTDGLPFLAMEYLDGRDLGTILAEGRRREQRPPLPVMLYIIEAICRGLSFAHSRTDASGTLRPVLHQGLSARSVFISHEGAVKLLGFGAAAARGRSPRAAELWQQAPACCSPEQARGLPVDARSDLFAVGAVLYEALVGRRAFPGDTAEQVRAAISAGRWVRPRELQPQLSQELEAIVVKALAADPAQRWQTADELEHALVRYAHQARVTASVKQIAAWMKAAHEEVPPQLADTDRQPVREPSPALGPALDDEPTPTQALGVGFDRAESLPPRNTLRGFAPPPRPIAAREEVTHDEPTTIRLADDDSSLERALEDVAPTPVEPVVRGHAPSRSQVPSDATVVVPEEDMVAQFGLVAEPVADPWADGPTVIDDGRLARQDAEELATPVNSLMMEELARRTVPGAAAGAPPARAPSAPTGSAAGAPAARVADGPAGPALAGVTEGAGAEAGADARRDADSSASNLPQGVAAVPAMAPAPGATGPARPRLRSSPAQGVGRWVLLGAMLGIALVLLVVAAVFWRTRAKRHGSAGTVVQGASRPDWRPEVVVLPEEPARASRPDAAAGAERSASSRRGAASARPARAGRPAAPRRPAPRPR